jgi:hypothetical protein
MPAWEVEVDELELRRFELRGMGGSPAEAPAPVVLPQPLIVGAPTVTSSKHSHIIDIPDIISPPFGGPPAH